MKREEFIISLIKASGESLMSFARKAGIPYTTLHSALHREAGIGKMSVDDVVRMGKVLGLGCEDLYHAPPMCSKGELTAEDYLAIKKFEQYLKVTKS